MKGISEDIDLGEKIDTGRMYAFCRILPMIWKVKDYEDVVAKKKEYTPKGLTPELIAQPNFGKLPDLTIICFIISKIIQHSKI